MSKVRVRFAPSPTGYLHVGGARTAIFNWLYARHEGGVFVLRIEDTDTQRSSEEMTRAILDGMAWLGMEPDEGPLFQSRNRDVHLAAASKLVSEGKAYRCFCDPDTLKARRGAAEKAGLPPTYPGTCRSVPGDEAAKRAEAGEPFAVRFKVPEGSVSWDDGVHGPTTIENAQLEDFVIVRSNGTPTYMLSVVSDDADTEITHIIRGDDHLSNTPKQILLYEALGHRPPVFAHLPMILGEDRKRLSKRHGAMSVLEYRDMGYLPGALFNFLSLLGWNPGDDREKMSREELVEAFSLDGIGKAAAAFDLQKLEWLNGQYLAEAPLESLVAPLREGLEKKGLWDERYAGAEREWLLRVLALVQPRCRTLPELAEVGEPFFYRSDDFEYDPKTVKKRIKGEHLAEWIGALRERLAALDEWTPDAMDACLRSLAEELGIGAGKLIHPTRLAVSGRGAGPGLFEILELVGRERTLARLDRLVAFVKSRAVS